MNWMSLGCQTLFLDNMGIGEYITFVRVNRVKTL